MSDDNIPSNEMLVQLVPVAPRSIGGNSPVQTVNGRDLHAFLQVATRYNDWIRLRINDFGFIEDIDFVSLTENLVSGGRRTEHFLSTDMAKELAMMERNARGRQIRRYFIECERIAHTGNRDRLPFHIRRYLRNARNVPQGYFSVLTEMFVTLFARMEAEGYEIPEHMWPDISQGRMFSSWLKKQDLGLSDVRTYPYELEDTGMIVEAKCYPDRLAGAFREHLLKEWIPRKSAVYFADRDPKALPFLTKLYPQALSKPE